MHVVELFLPIVANADTDRVLRELREEMTERFGGVTVFSRAPAEGEWVGSAKKRERDDVVVMEVMVETLDRSYWSALRERLERDLNQDEILIRAHQTIVL